MKLNIKTHNVRELWKSHITKKASLSDVFTGLDAIWTSYESFRQSLEAITSDQPGNDREITAAEKAAAKYMIENFDKAFDSIRPQVFSELRREAMEVKIARMRHAANLVARHDRHSKQFQILNRRRRCSLRWSLRGITSFTRNSPIKVHLRGGTQGNDSAVKSKEFSSGKVGDLHPRLNPVASSHGRTRAQ